MNNVNLEKIFNTTYKKLKKVKKLEIALRGGEFHLIEFEDNKIKKSSTKSDYYFSIRGIYKRNYFSFNSPIQDDLSNIIKQKQKEKYLGIKYPFLKETEYRDNSSLNINFEEFNNLLLIELISKPIFKLLKDKFIINGIVYLKKDRISPYSSSYPIVSFFK